MAAFGLLGCVAKKPPPDEASAGRQAGNPSANAPTLCTIKGKYTMKAYRAEVAGDVSKARFATLTTSARLEGNVVMYKHAVVDVNVGHVNDVTARFTWLQYDSELDPIVDGTTKLKIALHPLKITSEGCSARSVAFGAIHIAAMIVAEQGSGQFM
jgi:hypothetical protein